MSKRKSKILLYVLSVLFIVSCSIATIDYLFKPVKAGENDFVMLPEASVRLVTDSAGLRFKAEIAENAYNAEITYGMLIVPESYVSTNSITENYIPALESIYTANGILTIECTPYLTESGAYRINGAITNIKTNNYTRQFFGLAYSYDGTTYNYAMFTESQNVHSIYEIAKDAVGGDAIYSESQQAVLDGYIDEITEIEISKKATNLVYFGNENFNSEGMEVVAVHKDGTTKTKLTKYQIDKTNPLTSSDKTVTVSFGGLTTTQNIFVVDENSSPILNIADAGSFKIEMEDADKNLWIKQSGREAFDYVEDTTLASGNKAVGSVGTGSKIIIPIYTSKELTVIPNLYGAKYEENYSITDNVKFYMDGVELGVTNTPIFGHTDTNLFYNWQKVSLDFTTVQQGVHYLEIVVTNAGCNMDYVSFDVTDPNAQVVLSSIAVTTNPTKMSYNVNDIFDPMGMVVTATYSDDSQVVITDYSYDLISGLKPNQNVVTITYLTKNTTLNINLTNQIVINTPDNSQSKASGSLNNGYFEFDRTGSTMFTAYTDYVQYFIYDSTNATTPLGTFKVITNALGTKDETGKMMSMDGTVVCNDLNGLPGNGFLYFPSSKENFFKVIKYALGYNYSDSANYYFAVKVIAKEEPVIIDNVEVALVDSEISQISGASVVYDSTKPTGKFTITVIDGFIGGELTSVQAGYGANVSISASDQSAIWREVTGYDEVSGEPITGSIYNMASSFNLTVSKNLTLIAVVEEVAKDPLATLDNSTNKLMYYNTVNSYVEIDRQGTSMFTSDVDYVVVNIYDSSSATTPIGQFKIVWDGVSTGMNSGVISSMDGSISYSLNGGPTNMFTGSGVAAKAQVDNLISNAVGSSYNSSNDYYFAFQRVAKASSAYSNSAISTISATAWGK